MLLRTLVFILMLISIPSVAQELATRNVVIVTLDGYRWRELFEGADENILRKKKYVQDTSVRGLFDGASDEERRKKLMPFFWSTIADEGQLYGNRNHGNKMNLVNRTLYSYSGYSEMLVGFHDRQVKNNTPIPNPNYTVLESLNQTKNFQGNVAAFSTWQTMPFILRKDISGIHINSGKDKAEGEGLTRRERKLNKVTDHYHNPHGDRFDKFTFQYAIEYMRRNTPRVTFISFDETDEHGHGGRYDEYLKSAHAADSMIAHLWSWIQSHSDYKDKTTMIITTDHGRGTSARGWRGHALLFRGSAQVWMAVIGPDTPPTGEVKTSMRLKLNQVAATIAMLLNHDYKNVRPIGEPITSVIGERVASGAYVRE